MEVKLQDQTGKVEDISLVRGCLNLTMGNKTVAALVDTGASISAIKLDFLNNLSDILNPVFEPCSVFIYLADNSM